MKANQPIVDFINAANSLEQKRNHYQKIINDRTERIKQIDSCIQIIKGITATHKYSPEELLVHNFDVQYFFKSQRDTSALVIELDPPEDLMPNMERISIMNALISPMKIGGIGYVIRRVDLNSDCRGQRHSEKIVCMNRFLVE